MLIIRYFTGSVQFTVVTNYTVKPVFDFPINFDSS